MSSVSVSSPCAAYYVEMKEVQHGDGHTWEEVRHVEADINELEIRLRPYSTHHFRIIAENEIGRSHPSHESDTYSTPPASKTSGINNNNNNNNLTIIWTTLHPNVSVLSDCVADSIMHNTLC